MSLKRHRKSEVELSTGRAQSANLETLTSFGLEANDLQPFPDLLEKENGRVERETSLLPVAGHFTKQMDSSTDSGQAPVQGDRNGDTRQESRGRSLRDRMQQEVAGHCSR